MTPLELSTHLSSLLSAGPAPAHAPATPSPARAASVNDFNQHLLRFTQPLNSATNVTAPAPAERPSTAHGIDAGHSIRSTTAPHSSDNSQTTARAGDSRPGPTARSDKPAATSSKPDAPKRSVSQRDRGHDSNTNSNDTANGQTNNTSADATTGRGNPPDAAGDTNKPKSAQDDSSASSSDNTTVDAQAISDATATAAGLAINLTPAPLPTATVAVPSADATLTAVDPAAPTNSAATSSIVPPATTSIVPAATTSIVPAATTLASNAVAASTNPTTVASSSTPTNAPIETTALPDVTIAPSADANTTNSSPTASTVAALQQTPATSPAAAEIHAPTAELATKPIATSHVVANSAATEVPAADNSAGTSAAPAKPTTPRRARDAKSGDVDDSTAVPTPNQPLAVDVPQATPVGPSEAKVRTDDRSGQQSDRAAAALDRLSDQAAVDSKTPQSNSAIKLAGGGSTAKTGDTQPNTLSEADRARFVQRVARAVQSADSQNGPVRIRLSPPELGAMKIEVTVRDGVMSAKVETETPQARTALMDNLPQLRERLAEQNIKVERFDVDLMNQQSSGGTPDQRFIEATNATNRNRIRGVSSPSAGSTSPIAATQLNNGQLNVII